MKHSVYKSREELPMYLTVMDVADLLGISRASAYELVREQNFPKLKIVAGRIIIRGTDCLNGSTNRPAMTGSDGRLFGSRIKPCLGRGNSHRTATPSGDITPKYGGFYDFAKIATVSRVCRKRLPAGLKHENPLENRAFSVSQTVGQRKQKG